MDVGNSHAEDLCPERTVSSQASVHPSWFNEKRGALQTSPGAVSGGPGPIPAGPGPVPAGPGPVPAGRPGPSERRDELLDAVFALAGQREAQGLLDTLAERARSLLRGDTAHVHLLDRDHNEVRIVAVTGAISALTTTVRIPLGRSLIGQVFRTGMPASTESYLADREIDHELPSDRVIRTERIVSVVAVPLRRGSDVLAVLDVGQRHRRAFDADEIDLLARLAAHAALLLHARYEADAAAAETGDLRDAYDRLAVEHHALLRFTEADEQLLKIAVSEGTLDGLTQATAAVVGGGVVIVDLDDRELSASGRPEVDPNVLAAAVRRACEGTEPVATEGLVAVPVRAQGRLLAVLVSAGAHTVGSLELNLLRRVAAVAAVLLIHEESAHSASELARMEFLNDLLSARTEEPGLVRRGAQLRVDIRQPMCVLCVSSDLPRKRLVTAVHQAVAGKGGLAGTHHGTVVALLPGSDAQASAEDVHRGVAASTGHPVIVVGSGPANAVEELRPAQQEALRCLRALRNLGRADGAATMSTLGFLGLVLGPGNDPEHFIRSTIGSVIEYDTRKRTELERTLEAYLSTGGNAVAAAKLLHMHVNTIKMRLGRLTDLLGAGWRDPDRMFELYLAVRIRRATRS